MDLARAKGKASVSILMIKAIKFKLIIWTLSPKKKKKKKKKRHGAFGISSPLEGGAKWLKKNEYPANKPELKKLWTWRYL